MEYIHYGNTAFIPERFMPIRNIAMFSKPNGGFLASRVNAEYGWKDWCNDNDFRECEESNSFKFMLAENANILVINNVYDLEPFPKLKHPAGIQDTLWYNFIDFEHLYSDGIDAIEVNISADSDLYMALYGWDCDSILIMNPDIIVVNNESD